MAMEELIPSLMLGLVVLAVCGWVVNSRRRRWVSVGRLRNIYLYPLKSGKMKEVQEAECTPLGIKSHSPDGSVPLRDRMWAAEKVCSVDCGDEIAKWMSEILRGKPYGLRVGYWPETEKWRRNIETIKANEIVVHKKMANKFIGAYAYLSSYLLLNHNSVDDLNSKLEEGDKVSVENFRPNLVIEGVDPYAEDKWDWIKIGEVVFRNFRPCTRCAVTTINPDTGVRNTADEPLRTLRKYRTMRMLGEDRLEANDPVMGAYVGIIKAGYIKVGDNVYVSK